MKKGLLIGLIAGALSLALLGGVAAAGINYYANKYLHGSKEEDSETVSNEQDDEEMGTKSAPAKNLRPHFITLSDSDMPKYTPSVEPYQTDKNLSNVINKDYVYLDDAELEKLAQNNFFVTGDYYREFFEKYEDNRYAQFPNFITTDSMMHTYHLYFAMLQKKTEKNSLASTVEQMSKEMLEQSRAQYDVLKGSEWEDAAKLNVAFFTIGASLQDPDVEVDDYVSETVEAELKLIEAHDDLTASPLIYYNGEFEDYSQYKPRGYYEGDEQLEKYFRTMMWYGRRNFMQEFEEADRCALLMTLALKEGAIDDWEKVYTVTSFFAGASDDNGYYEYLPLIEDAYGANVKTEDLIGAQKEFSKFRKLTAKLEPPKINSVPFDDDEGETDKTERAKGFRFMGQRFSLDEAIFTQLTYSKVKKNDREDKRMLPDALDVPAALGSEVAYEILKEENKTDYPNYDEQLQNVREEIKAMPELWTGSLYAAWMNTLNPLLKEKGEGYPSFMTNREWTKKSLETYLGSWTELKHDTVLYSKQMMAEMGGGELEVIDDRGYVEPEPELYYYLKSLTEATSNGLKQYGLLDSQDEEDLGKLAQLCDRLCTISVKELENKKLTDDEFELIRCYGGTLEHFWNETVKATSGQEENFSDEYPASLVVDVATDPNGAILEEGIGGLSVIYVVVPVGKSLRVASGLVYNYYQFTQPLSDRLTDSQWRRMTGMEVGEDYETFKDPDLDQKKPEWTKSYRVDKKYENY